MPCEGVLSIVFEKSRPLQPGAPGSPGPAHRRLSVVSGGADREGSRLRHDGLGGGARARQPRRADLLLLLRRLPREIREGAAGLSEAGPRGGWRRAAHATAPVGAASADRLDLPDAPGGAAANRPGDCPICGMALEPIAPAAASDANPELADMRRRFWVSAALTVPVVALAMAMVDGPVGALGGGDPVGDRGDVGRPGLLRARGGVAGKPALEHVHADRAGRGRLVRLQPDDAGLPRSDAAAPAGQQDGGAGLLRGRGDHRHAGAARPGAGARRAPADGGGHPGAARPFAQARRPDPARRRR